MLNKIFHQTNHKSILIAVLLGVFFVISLLISLPEKKQIIGKRHQDLIAHQLITYSLWDRYGFFHYKGGLILTYPNPGDLNIKADDIQTGKNSKGEYYYFSYPPFSFYLTYFLLKIFHLSIDEFSVRTIASFFLFLNLLAFFMIFKEKAIFPALSYIFLPNVLWFHHNVWFLDMLVITLVLWSIYFSFSKPIPFFITIFLACFTEWWAFLWVFSVFLWIKLQEKGWAPCQTNLPVGKILFKNPKNQMVLFLSAFSAILIYFLIHFLVLNPLQFFENLYDKFLLRAGVQQKADKTFFVWNLNTYVFILWYYLRNYLLILFIIIFAMIKIPLFRKAIYIFPLFFSILLHHILLLNWTAEHDFSVLKSAIIFPFFIYEIYHELPIKKQYYSIIIWVAIIVFHLNRYYHHVNVKRQIEYLELSECVKKVYKQNEVVKANYKTIPSSYIWWKSERIVLRDSLDTKCR